MLRPAITYVCRDFCVLLVAGVDLLFFKRCVSLAVYVFVYKGILIFLSLFRNFTGCVTKQVL